jgi:hypothetical protein
LGVGRGGEHVEVGAVGFGEVDVVAGEGCEVVEQAAEVVQWLVVLAAFGAGLGQCCR